MMNEDTLREFGKMIAAASAPIYSLTAAGLSAIDLHDQLQAVVNAYTPLEIEALKNPFEESEQDIIDGILRRREIKVYHGE